MRMFPKEQVVEPLKERLFLRDNYICADWAIEKALYIQSKFDDLVEIESYGIFPVSDSDCFVFVLYVPTQGGEVWYEFYIGEEEGIPVRIEHVDSLTHAILSSLGMEFTSMDDFDNNVETLRQLIQQHAL